MFQVFGPAHSSAYWVMVLLTELDQPFVHRPEAPADRPDAVLQDGEQIFNQGLSSCLYLADKFARLAPAPASPERQLYLQICQSLAPVEALLRQQGSASQTLAAQQLQQLWQSVRPILQHQPYLLGQYSLADLLLASSLSGLLTVGLIQPVDPLAAYLQRILSRQAFQRPALRLSVVVLASPAPEADYVSQLALCLEMLTRQSLQASEVLVITDADGVAVCRTFAGKLPLQCLPAQSGFNQAAAAASGHWLVCLNAATLLNPEALKSYAAYLATPGQKLVFGYLGTSVDQTEATADHAHAPSQWFPAHQVAYLDYRIQRYRRHSLHAAPDLMNYPYLYATGSNFAISRPLALLLGWDESLEPGRLAAVDLAYRALQAGVRIDFLVDAWGEQLLQTRREPGLPARRFAWLKSPARLLTSQSGSQTLLQQLFTHYLPQDARQSDTQASLLEQPEAEVYLKVDHYQLLGLYQLAAKPPGARPDFLIIGAPRAGTNSLHHSLRQHPRLCHSLCTEIDFFSREEQFAKGKTWYLDQFYFAEGKLSYETSATYLYAPEAPGRIAAWYPEIRLIAVLREPVSRGYSAWNLRHSLPVSHPEHEPRSFEQVVRDTLAGNNQGEYFERGKYAEQLRRYLACFPRDQLLLLDFDKLLADLGGVLDRCCEFLGLERFAWDLQLAPRFAQAYSAPLPEALEQALKVWFAPYNQQLREEFGLDYAWLRS